VKQRFSGNIRNSSDAPSLVEADLIAKGLEGHFEMGRVVGLYKLKNDIKSSVFRGPDFAAIRSMVVMTSDHSF
jgi:hypothetical protein